MPTINLPEIPKFLDESLTPAAQEIGLPFPISFT